LFFRNWVVTPCVAGVEPVAVLDEPVEVESGPAVDTGVAVEVPDDPVDVPELPVDVPDDAAQTDVHSGQ